MVLREVDNPHMLRNDARVPIYYWSSLHINFNTVAEWHQGSSSCFKGAYIQEA